MKKTLFAMGLGAGIMYLFDPEHGEERRNQLREKLTGFSGAMPKTAEAVHAKVDALADKAQELSARADDAAAEAIASAPPHDGGGAEGASDDGASAENGSTPPA